LSATRFFEFQVSILLLLIGHEENPTAWSQPSSPAEDRMMGMMLHVVDGVADFTSWVVVALADCTSKEWRRKKSSRIMSAGCRLMWYQAKLMSGSSIELIDNELG